MVELATQSSNRQTKVSACELLHSLILYTLGRSAQQPGEIQKRNPMDSLYRKLFPALLSLSCDVEQVRQRERSFNFRFLCVHILCMCVYGKDQTCMCVCVNVMCLVKVVPLFKTMVFED